MSTQADTTTGSSQEPAILGSMAIVHAALSIGMASGLVNVAYRYARAGEMIDNIMFPTYFTWMAPAADVAVMLAAGILLAVIARVIRIAARPVAVYTLLGTPPCLMLAMTVLPQIHALGSAVLAAGVSYQAARLVVRVRDRLARPRSVMRWYWAVSLLAVTASTLTVFGSRWGDARRQVAERPDAPSGAPNVLVVTLDVLRAESTSLHGYERETTPNLDRRARGGTVFDRAFATTSWTLPSHASLFTGLPADDTGTSWRVPLADDHETLAEVLRDRGYDTAGFAANWDFCTWRTGLAQGFVRYEDYVIRPETILNCTMLGRFMHRKVAGVLGRPAHPYAGRKRAGKLTDDFLAWLGGRDESRPFFAFVNYIDMHKPFDAPPPFAGMFDHRTERPDPRAVARLSDPDGHNQLRDLDRYDDAIAYVDHHLERALAALETQGLLENTLVVITSDHGHTFDEHFCAGHGYSLYLETIHIPLVVLFPGRIPAGRRIGEAVSLADVGRTVLELGGVDGAERFPGRSLVGLIDGSGGTPPGMPACFLPKGLRPQERALNLNGTIRSVIDGDWHLIDYEDPEISDELFDIANDPFEQENRIAEPGLAERVARMRGALRASSE